MSKVSTRGERNNETRRTKASLPCCPQVRSTLTAKTASIFHALSRRIASAAVILVSLLSSTKAAIDRLTLGARAEGNRSQITFRVYSARATRIDLYIYKQAAGAQETASFPLTKDSNTRVWSLTLPIATLGNELGITGTIYYGYRTWGPNWLSAQPGGKAAPPVSSVM